jgi:hypothetical protein
MMKRPLIFILLLSVAICSCEEDFNPTAEFKQQYALFCIINGDTTYQFAVLAKSYSPENYESTKQKDLIVKGADIFLTYENKIFTLKEREYAGGEDSLSYYYTDTLKPAADKILNMKAILPDGKILQAATKTPKSTSLSFNTRTDISDTFIEEKPDGIFLIWQIIGGANEKTAYIPSLKIIYFKDEDGKSVQHEKNVPISYGVKDGIFVPNYPVLIHRTELVFSMDAVNRAMEEIAGGDPEKKKYSISHAVFSLMVLDENLTAYYMSLQSNLDGFTVILDEPEFTNIDGGLGVFGSFFKRTHRMSFDPKYVEKFGYKVY